ncbi:MAG: hypothetical protein RL033_5227, partial [Pseudomonadota bacterium]
MSAERLRILLRGPERSAGLVSKHRQQASSRQLDIHSES